MKVLPTQDRLHELFYCVNGVLYVKNRTPRSPRQIGDKCGHIHSNGYVYTCVDKISYSTHRLVWKYYYGVDPVNEIDHIDRNRSNNNIWNLRNVSSSENSINTNVTMNIHQGRVQRETINGKSVLTDYGRQLHRERMRMRRQNTP